MNTTICGANWVMSVNLFWATLKGVDGSEDQYNFGYESPSPSDVRSWATMHLNYEHAIIKAHFDQIFNVVKPLQKIVKEELVEKPIIQKKNYEERLHQFLEKRDTNLKEFNDWLSEIETQIAGIEGVDAIRNKLNQIRNSEGCQYRAWLSDLIGSIS